MLFDIYHLGEKGSDPVVAMLRKPQQGELRIRKRFPGRSDTNLIALVRRPGEPEGEPFLEMHNVRMVAMNSESFVLEGTVGHPRSQSFKSRVDYTTERWLCKPPGTRVVVDAEVIRRRSTDLTKAMQADPFHPVWDNIDDTSYGPVDPSIT